VYCNPASGNEKGSVENGVGYCRRNFLSGCPSYPNFDTVNKYLEQRCLQDISKNTKSRNTEDVEQTIFEKVACNLKPLLPIRKWAKREHRLVNRYQMVEVYDHFYSVPEMFVGEYLKVAIGAFNLAIYDKEELIYEHVRIFTPGVDALLLDHYLDQLRKKPGALWDCKATKGLLDDKALEVIWERLSERNPTRKAQKDFIEILYLKKKYTESEWKAGINKTLECGAYEPTAVESIIKMLITPSNSYNEKAIQEQLKHIVIPMWECNLSKYATLSKGGASTDSRHGNAMLGRWNAPIADEIMDDYLLEKIIKSPFILDFPPDRSDLVECTSLVSGGDLC
jgi:hypothetical protein